MGPLGLLDLIGLDSTYEILDAMYRQFRETMYAPSPLIKQLVTAGFLGRKSGRGFYQYEEPGSSRVKESGSHERHVPETEPRQVGVHGERVARASVDAELAGAAARAQRSEALAEACVVVADPAPGLDGMPSAAGHRGGRPRRSWIRNRFGVRRRRGERGCHEKSSERCFHAPSLERRAGMRGLR